MLDEANANLNRQLSRQPVQNMLRLIQRYSGSMSIKRSALLESPYWSKKKEDKNKKNKRPTVPRKDDECEAFLQSLY
jgi:hypothetical protein